MAIALVQSNLGGHATGAATVAFSTYALTSAAFGFGVTTTPGNFLVYGAWSTYSITSAGSISQGTITPTTSGFAWTIGTSLGWSTLSGGSGNLGEFSLYYIQNASAMSVNTVAVASINGSGTIVSAKVEFALMEFSGVLQSGTVTDAIGIASNNSSSTPSKTITTTASDLIIAGFSSAVGSNLSAGSGFTLGPAAIVATVGQLEYALNVAAATVTAAFSGTEPAWGLIAAAFFPATSTAAAAFTHSFPVLIL